MREVILAKCGEMVLKGLNRSRFDNAALKNLRRAIGERFTVRMMQSTVYIEPEEGADIGTAYEKTKRVFGFVAVSRAAVCEKDMDAIRQTAVEYIAPNLDCRTFKVESRRADKRFPFKSPDISREIGGTLLSACPHLKVDVHDPDVTVFVEIREQGAYLHAGQEPGAGGMPYGTSGKSVLMLSGGIDSPVAGYMCAKRGVSILPLHFFSPPYTGERAKQKVIKLAEILKDYCPDMRLHVVHFTEIQQQILEKCREDLFTVIMRRFMMRVAYAVMVRNNADSLITGESLGQVASQTMHALRITDATTPALTLRPLIGMDKEEIVRISRKIGAFETSTLPYEDCCTVFTPRHPKTKPRLSDVEAEEQKLDIDALVARAMENIEQIELGGTL